MLRVGTEGWADEISRSRVVVTGGAGFLGWHVCTALLDAGAEVVCVDNFVTGSVDRAAELAESGRGFQLLKQDVRDPFDVSGTVDVVLHLASPASPVAYRRAAVDTLRTGSEGTLNALRLAADHEARIVIASTSEVYGDPLVNPQPEGYWGNVSSIGPRSMYDEAKRYAEALTVACVNEWGVDAAIVRIFNTYGPGMAPDDGRIVSAFVRQALTGEPLTVHGLGEQTRSLCHVTDTVRGLLLMAVGEHRGPVNLGNPDERTVLEIAELVRATADSSSPLAFGDSWPDDPLRRCPDITLARNVLGWEPHVALDEGLADTIAWYRSELRID